MKRLLTTFACLLCFVLNASMSDVSPLEKSRFLDDQTVGRTTPLGSQENLSLHLAKGFRPPRGTPKLAPKPKSQPTRQEPKSSGKNAPKGSHDKNQRESNREKHEKGDARRQREQKKAERKRERNKKNK